jgi:Glycosyltransferase like family
MISVIICSVNPVLLASVKKNIAETIGVPYELISIDNSLNQYGICKAYNEGGSKARFPVLCFMHEDVAFETMNWGTKVCEHLAGADAGLLGVAGGDSKALVPSSWSVPVISNEINLVQHYKSGQAPAKRIIETGELVKGSKQKVIAADGVWLCTKKSVFDQFKFDETNFPGFHGYDIDYSLQVGTTYSVYVVFDILIHHFSEGSPDRKWVESAVQVSKKWKKRLPVSVYNLNSSQYSFHHWHSLRVYLQHLFRLQYSYSAILMSLFTYSFTRFFSIRRFLSMSKYVLISMYSAGKAHKSK